MKRALAWWRHATLAGLAGGLLLAPLLEGAPPEPAVASTLVAIAASGLALTRPGGEGPHALAWLALVAAVAAGAGVTLGTARLGAIEAGALRGPSGAAIEVRGWLLSQPRGSSEGLEAELEAPQGRVLLRGSDLHGLGVGDSVAVRGRLLPLAPWRAEQLRRRGIAMALEAEAIVAQGRPRGGLEGRIDRIRERAESALGRGMPERESALARGFVLGQDEQIDPRTREDFRRSGLSHLLAVSGQNVVLLCLLAWPLLALAGIPLRARLVALLGLIALYVGVTGAGPSIQRAAVMGAAGLIAALADRPSSRWYGLLLAVVVTLGLNPLAAGDVGWQLSFAAVAGIFLWTARLAALLDGGAPRGSPRRALAEGLAMTAAATAATAPLLAHHFDSLSLSSLAANVLALPAVAPAMWLGMLAGMAGQLPALPVEPLNWLNSHCLAYISQIARWLGSPSWAQLRVGLDGPLAVATAYLALVALAELALRAARRRGGLGLRSAEGRSRGTARIVTVACIAVSVLVLVAAPRPGGDERPAENTLVIRVLDVGQGDAIMLDPPAGEPVLVDTGPADAEVAARLTDLGVRSLDAVLITHDQSDHAGGLPHVVRSLAVDRVLAGHASPSLRGLAAATGAELVSAAEGSELRFGDLRLSVLWPPRELLAAAPDDPNSRSLVLLAEWRHLSLLLSGDAEAEAVPLDPGPVDLLKVAHHGSEDQGLAELLDRAAPKLAVISVGDNGYGHPAPETLAALREHGVPVVRTDEGGDVVIEADPSGWRLGRDD